MGKYLVFSVVRSLTDLAFSTYVRFTLTFHIPVKAENKCRV